MYGLLACLQAPTVPGDPQGQAITIDFRTRGCRGNFKEARVPADPCQPKVVAGHSKLAQHKGLAGAAGWLPSLGLPWGGRGWSEVFVCVFLIHPEYRPSRQSVTLSTCPSSGARQGTEETSVTPVEAGTLGHKHYGARCLVRGRAVP